MNLALSEEQVLLRDSFARLLQNESTPARIRAAEPLGFDPALWADLVAAGTPLMRVPEASGGAGLAAFDAVIVAELAGGHLASAPVVESIVAARLLSSSQSSIARSWLDDLGGGKKIVTLALAPVVAGQAQIVPSGAIADAVLYLSGETLFLAEVGEKGAAPANLGSLPLAVVDIAAADGARPLLQGAEAVGAWRSALDEWKLLVSAMLAAMARRSLDEAAAYSKDRLAFDRPIGSYQGLAHPLADAVTEVDAARLLVWRAASARDAAGALVPLAYWWAIRSAATATVKAMRAFGGYGMSMEYDAQLYFRRSRAWSMLAGDPERELEAAAERLWGARPGPNLDGDDTMITFEFGPAAERYAEAARTFFRQNMTPEMERFAFETDDGDHPFNAELASAGFLFADWPVEHGGGGRSPYELAALRSVYAEFAWPKVLGTVTHMVGKILMHFASEPAKREILPRFATGRANAALGYSEPSCGSDIFAAKTRAVRDGDDWIIDGQKMFTSQGHLAQYMLLIARTAPELPKHAGLTLFIAPLDLPGYEVHEVKTLGAERTNITYFTGMRVPDRYRVGEVNGGAKVMGAALALEQSGGDFFVGALHQLQKHALAWARTPGYDGAAPIEQPRVRARLAAVQARIEVADLLDRRCLWAFAENAVHKAYGPMAKLFASEALVSCTTELAELTAPWSLLQAHTDLGRIELESRKAVQATIYGGTSEVQRSIIAESALGMPRTRS